MDLLTEKRFHEGHEHSHEYEHLHVHQHPHTVTAGETTAAETRALLSYMIHHNDTHNEELADLMGRLPEKAAKKLSLVIGAFEAANVQLQEVLDELE